MPTLAPLVDDAIRNTQTQSEESDEETELYEDEEFKQALEKTGNIIIDRSGGIERYGKSQCEVILELEHGTTAEIWKLGGLGGTTEQLTREAFGEGADANELRAFEDALNKAGLASGMPWWLSHEGTKNVMGRVS